MTAQYQITDFTTDTPAELKAKLDANSAVVARTAAAFQCYAAATPNRTVKIAAGGAMVADAFQEKAIQTSGTITAPVTHPRIDRVVIDQITGAASIVTGAEAASPSAPAIPAGKIPVAQIALATGTTAITNSLITDERPFVVFPSVAGLTEDTTPDLAAAFALVWDTSAGAFKKVKLNKIGITADNWARDNILLLFLRDAITSGIASGAMRDGISDAYLTDTIGSTSTNETYDGTGKYYHNTGGLSQISTSGATLGGDMTGGGGVAAAFDGNVSQSSATGAFLSVGGGVASGHVKAQFTTAKRVTKFAFTSLNDFGFSYNAADYNANVITLTGYGSNDGSSWTQLCQQTGVNNTTGTAQRIEITVGAPGNYLYYKGEITKTGGGNVWPGLSELQLYETLAPANMTLIPAAATAQSAPTSARVVVLHKPVDATTLNTDFTAEVTRDGGTTWSAITLSNVGAYDTDYNILEGTADISGQPSGTSMKYRLKTLNNKTQRVKGTALAWG